MAGAAKGEGVQGVGAEDQEMLVPSLWGCTRQGCGAGRSPTSAMQGGGTTASPMQPLTSHPSAPLRQGDQRVLPG